MERKRSQARKESDIGTDKFESGVKSREMANPWHKAGKLRIVDTHQYSEAICAGYNVIQIKESTLCIDLQHSYYGCTSHCYLAKKLATA